MGLVILITAYVRLLPALLTAEITVEFRYTHGKW
jgi:hypothetical protein